MSRLDDEYDPAAHHDLDGIVEHPGSSTDRRTFTALCACGWASSSSSHRGDHYTRNGAFQAWGHRQREWFG